MALYNYVKNTVDCLSINELTEIDVPEKLMAFRKFLSEIGKNEGKRFTTKVYNNKLHIMRVNYYSLTEKINNND